MLGTIFSENRRLYSIILSGKTMNALQQPQPISPNITKLVLTLDNSPPAFFCIITALKHPLLNYLYLPNSAVDVLYTLNQNSNMCSDKQRNNRLKYYLPYFVESVRSSITRCSIILYILKEEKNAANYNWIVKYKIVSDASIIKCILIQKC